MNWYYLNGGMVVGPVTIKKLAELKEQGILSEESQIAREGDDGWTPYGSAVVQMSGIKVSEIVKTETSDSMSPVVPELEKRYALSTLKTLAVCCLFYGYIFTSFFPPRYLVGGFQSQMGAIILLGLPSLALGVYGICRFLRPEYFPVRRSVASMTFTMIAGLAALLLFQKLAEMSLHSNMHASGKAGVVVVLLKFVGWAYEASQADSAFQRLLGSVFGIGLCEEFTKLVPLFYLVFRAKQGHPLPTYRSFLIIGFFSGLGFGIGEAFLCYSPWMGNIEMSGNVTRWFTCVPMHAVYTVIDAAFLWLLAPALLRVKTTWAGMGVCVLASLAVAVVHGLYDALLLIPHAGFAIDVASLILMMVVVRAIEPRSAGAHALSRKEEAEDFSDWLQKIVTRKRLKIAYVSAGVFILASLGFSDSKERVQAWLDGANEENAGFSNQSYYGDPSQTSSTYSSSAGRFRGEAESIIARRYPGKYDLQREILQGVMALREIYPEYSAGQLVAKFEQMASGG